MSHSSDNLTFWDHLDVLRSTLMRICIVAVVFMLVAFCFKDEVFAIIFAPRDTSFPTYRLFDQIAVLMGHTADASDFAVSLINTELTRQFMVHLQVSLWVGLLVASPYILVEIFRFVSPALYSAERRYAVGVTVSGYLMFMFGVALCYFLIFPLTFRFLGTYQVSNDVTNLISLESYIDTLTMLTLMMGLMSELPVVGWLLAKLGFINAGLMRRFRRHAIVGIFIAAAIITPTTDAMTLCVVALPIMLLYELTILIVSRTIARTT